jgi:hypothetical protein
MKELVIKLSGEVKESNLDEFRSTSLALIKGINTKLITDDDFDEAKKAIKVCDASIKTIKAAREKALNGTVEISDLFNALDDLESELKKTKKSLNDQVKSETEKRKCEIVDNAMGLVKEEVEKHTHIHPVIKDYAFARSQFLDGGKHKRTMETYAAGVNSVADFHVENVGVYAEEIMKKVEILKPYLDEYPAIFHDENDLIQQDTDMLSAILTARINAFRLQESEKARVEEAKRAKAAIAKAEESRRVEEASENKTIDTQETSFAENKGTQHVESATGQKSTYRRALKALIAITLSEELAEEIIEKIKSGNIPGVEWNA